MIEAAALVDPLGGDAHLGTSPSIEVLKEKSLSPRYVHVVDDDRDVLIVHIVDAGDPEGVRERHRREYERRQRNVVP